MPHPIDTIIGNHIRGQRQLRKWTQEFLGNKLGVSGQQLQKYERGLNSVPPKNLKRLAELFGCTINDFFYDRDLLPFSEDIRTYSHLQTHQIKDMIKDFLSADSPLVHRHICAVVKTLAGMEHTPSMHGN